VNAGHDSLFDLCFFLRGSASPRANLFSLICGISHRLRDCEACTVTPVFQRGDHADNVCR
jgi:hypothetical protein